MRLARKIGSLVAIMAATLALTVTVSASVALAADPKPVGCEDGYQIGTTANGVWNGITVSSVKQYYSPRCNANWSYVYIWQGFRDRGYKWVTDAYINVNGSNTAYGSVVRHNWIHTYSVPAGTVNLCTRAAGTVDIYSASGVYLDTTHTKYTSWRPTGCGS